MEVDVFSNVLTARVFYGRNPKVVELHPILWSNVGTTKWLDNGAVVGMQGGRAVLKTLQRLSLLKRRSPVFGCKIGLVPVPRLSVNNSGEAGFG